MPEGTERLKEFRAQYRGGSSQHKWLLIIQTIVLLVGFAVLFTMLGFGGKVEAPARFNATSAGGLSPDALREYAAYLAEKHLPLAAIDAYEEYLDKAALEDPERANVCYSAAKLAVDAEDYSKALALLYQAELLDPESELKDEINKKVALCLDKLGRNVELRRELRRRSDLARKASDLSDDEVILAEFGDEVITDRDLEQEIEELPGSVRKSLDVPENELEFLKNLVAERLLVDKARRLELDKSEEIQEALAKQLDAMMVRRLIDDELRDRVHVTPEEVERYYKAEIEHFTIPEAAQVRIAEAATAEKAKVLTDFPEEEVTVQRGRAIPGLPESPETVDLIFATDPGELAGPVAIEGKWYVFEVVSRAPEEVRPFEEVKEQARRMLQFTKEQEQLRALIEETLEARDVRLHPERLKGTASAS